MTPAVLKSRCRALYGGRWRAGLAAALNLPPTTVASWASGHRPVPVWMDSALALLEGQVPSGKQAYCVRLMSGGNYGLYPIANNGAGGPYRIWANQPTPAEIDAAIIETESRERIR